MNRLISAVIASALTLAAASAYAADLTNDERTEMRARAERMQVEGQRNPSWDGGETRLNQSRGDVRLDKNRSDVKMGKHRSAAKNKAAGTKKIKKAKKAKKQTKRHRAKERAKHAVSSMPGALVR